MPTQAPILENDISSLDHSLEGALATMSRLVLDAQQREQMCKDQRAEARWAIHMRVQATPIVEGEAAIVVPGPRTMTAYTSDLSATGVGLLHVQPIDTRRILLTFELIDGTPITLVVALKWSCAVGDFGYASGGNVSAVLKRRIGAGPETVILAP